ncbi:hypothetical protein [Thalassospira australica]|uniref:hypothetical protein n=1 Tax=Thalassospira australica TaxID=1528106 RepID=UPI003850AC05
MSGEMHLKLTLQNTGSTPLHLTSLAPQSGWQSAPPHHLAPESTSICDIAAAGELAITLRYGTHHIGLHLDHGALHVDPGDATVSRQKLDGHSAEVTLSMV